MAFTGSSLYAVADGLGVSPITDVARQAGVISVLRIIAYYPERQARHTVTTAIERHQDRRSLEVVYEGFFKHQPMKLPVSREQLDKVLDALRQARFDKLDDQPDLSYREHSLWLIQRASGLYTHGVIVSPDIPHLPYSAIVNAIDHYLSEAIREVPLT